MKKKILFFLFFLFCSQVQSIEIKIIHNIQNEIITNIDIKNEFRYLVALNSALKELDKDKILIISNNSIIKEKIKKIESFFSCCFILKPSYQVKKFQVAQ